MGMHLRGGPCCCQLLSKGSNLRRRGLRLCLPRSLDLLNEAPRTQGVSSCLSCRMRVLQTLLSGVCQERATQAVEGAVVQAAILGQGIS